ncbi:MAG TPA: M50 family metallopeptidase [Streptomyces sp.]|jgi:putative peptide zinc metalloprotease protein|nr:M50 family metallopeptidase [Streptomyces sp.]
MTVEPPELRSYRPALRQEVLISPPLLRAAATVHLIKDPHSGASFEVGAKEHFLLSRLDGGRTLEEIGTDYAHTFGKRLGEANWQQLLGLLGSRGLLVGAPLKPRPPQHPDVPDGMVTGSLLKGRVRMVADAGATTDRLHRLLRPLLRVWLMLPLLALCLAMELLLVTQLGEFARDTWWLLHQPVPLLAVCVAIWFSIALHELAHGVAARQYGGTVSEIGLRWRLPMAIMYCTVDNYLYLRRRRHQLVIAGAGVFMNLVLLLPATAWWVALPPGDPTRKVLAGLVVLGSVQALANLVPLPPLDGYAMLSHALRISGYAPESGRYLRLRLRDRAAAAAYPRRARALYTAYGIGSALLVCTLLAGLMTAVYFLMFSPGSY